MWLPYIVHTDNLPFLTFDLTLKILSVIQGTQKETVTVEQTPGCLCADTQIYQLRVVVQSSLPLFSDFTKESLAFDCWN